MTRNDPPSPLPAKIFIVQCIIPVEKGDIVGQIFGGWEVLDMDVGVGWSCRQVVGTMGAKDYGYDVVAVRVYFRNYANYYGYCSLIYSIFNTTENL